MRIVTSLIVIVLLSATAEAATYHVAKTGSSSNTCTQAQSAATPRLTILGGIACLVAGDTLLVHVGDYNETILDNVPSGTSWTNKVRIAAAPGEIVWMRPTSGQIVISLNLTEQYVEFDGINIDARGTTLGGPVKLETWSGGNVHHIRIQNAELISSGDGIPNQGTNGGSMAIIVTNSRSQAALGSNEFINLTVHGGGDVGDYAYGFYIQSSDNLIERCNIYDTAVAGIQTYNGYGFTADRTIIRYNTIHDITRTPTGQIWGMILASGSGNLVYNNVIYGMGGTIGAGIQVYTSDADKIYHNTIYGGAVGGISIDTAPVGTVVENNIAYANAGGDFNPNGSTSSVTNLFNVNPLFVNATTANFRLQAGSPAIDTGTTNTVTTVDKDGIVRPQGSAFDKGAYEYFSAGTTVPSAPVALRVVPN